MEELGLKLLPGDVFALMSDDWCYGWKEDDFKRKGRGRGSAEKIRVSKIILLSNKSFGGCHVHPGMFQAPSFRNHA